MAAKHRTQSRYTQGCRCVDCVEAHKLYQRDYRRQRKASGAVTPRASVIVESAQVQERPGLAQTALTLARILDNPRAVSSQPAAARQLVAILSMLSRRSHRRAKLGVVKSMTEGARWLMGLAARVRVWRWP